MPVPSYFCYYGPIVYFNVKYDDTSSIALSAQDYFSYLGSFMLPNEFQDCVFFNFVKNVIGILMGIVEF
jgi:hypothetical protein